MYPNQHVDLCTSQQWTCTPESTYVGCGGVGSLHVGEIELKRVHGKVVNLTFENHPFAVHNTGVQARFMYCRHKATFT